MRKLIYYIATSLDGFVCRPDGSLDDFSFEGEHVNDLLANYPETIPTHLRTHLDVTDDNKCFDTVLMGWGTYEVGLQQGVTSPYQHLRQYVFSRSARPDVDEDLQIVAENSHELVRDLKAEAGGLDIWLCGGPTLATELLHQIDEVILKINPFFMGAGKTLFASEFPKRSLRAMDRCDYENGFSIQRFAM